MHHQNILMLCQQSWSEGLGTNARSLALEFARHNRVLYVSTPMTLNDLLFQSNSPRVRQQLRVVLGREPSLVEVEPNVWVLTPVMVGLSLNWLPWRRLFKLLNQLNAWLLARCIRKGLQTLNFGTFDLLLDGILYQAVEIKRLLQPRRFIYYLRDYMVTVPYFRRHGAWAEARLMASADVVAANSAYLADYARPFNPRSYDIGQGCALDRYQAHRTYEEPADLTAVPYPRIVYVGFLTSLRLDLKLLTTLARQRPQWSLVLVGPEDPAFRASALHGLPNVFFLGAKAPAELMAYLHHCQVCINPQLLNEVTTGNYPLKIDEYLAMGKPVVGTATETMKLFADYVYLARDPAGWLTALEAALAEDASVRAVDRIAFAQSHNWPASVARLYAALDEIPPANDGSVINTAATAIA